MLTIGNIHMTFTDTDRGLLVTLKRHGIQSEGYFGVSPQDPLSRFFRQVFDSDRNVESSWLSECQDLYFNFVPAMDDKDAVLKGSLCIDVDDDHGAFEVKFAYDIQLDEISVDYEALDRAFKIDSD